MEKNVFIVVVTRNNAAEMEKLAEPLRDLIAQGHAVVVVDDGSTDGTQAVIKARTGKILLIENKKRLGFVKSANVGITFAIHNRASHILLVAPTIRFEPMIIDALFAKQADIIAPIIGKRENGKEFFGVGGRLRPIVKKPVYTWMTNRPPQSFNATPEFVSFSCVGISRRTFEKVGLLDEIFLTFFSDIDFCRRAKKAGFKLAISSKAIVAQVDSKKNPVHGRIEKQILLHDYAAFIKKYTFVLLRPIAMLYTLVLRVCLIFLPKQIVYYK